MTTLALAGLVSIGAARAHEVQPAVADVVVGAYLADVRFGPDGPEPAHFREAFRAGGPTNRDHGKAHGRRPGPEVL